MALAHESPDKAGTNTVTIYGTQNGGESWTSSLTFPEGNWLFAGWIHFFDDHVGIALGTGGNRLLRTTDGGKKWETLELPAAVTPSMISFPKPDEGWVLQKLVAASGSEEAAVYHTTDGGREWHRVSLTSPMYTDVPGQLPAYGNKSGLAFKDASVGWVSGSTNALGVTWLNKSLDGGHHWQPEHLGVPREWASAEIATLPPRFFSHSDGVLPVVVNSNLYLYFTQDGGVHWGRPVLLPGSADWPTPPPWEFIDDKQGWVAAGNQVWGTVDGGKSWEVLSALDPKLEFARIRFVTPKVGWAVVTAGSPVESSEPSLMHTVDGGRHWKPLQMPR